MNQEWVEITGLADGGVWVEGVQRSACGSCSARAGCGQHTLNALSRPLKLWVPAAGNWRVGQQVLLVLPAGGLAKSALLLYGLPLAGLMVAAAAGQLLGGEGAAVVAGGAGLAAGFWLSHRLTHHFGASWHPQIVAACEGPLIHSDAMQSES